MNSTMVPLFLIVAVLMAVMYAIQAPATKEMFHEVAAQGQVAVAQASQATTQGASAVVQGVDTLPAGFVNKPKGFSISDNNAVFSSITADNMKGEKGTYDNIEAETATFKTLDTNNLNVAGDLKAKRTTFDSIDVKTVNTPRVESVYTATGELLSKEKLCVGPSCASSIMMGDDKANSVTLGKGNTPVAVKGNLAVYNSPDSWNWVHVHRGDADQLFFGGDKVNRGVWSHGTRPFSIYTSGANRFQVNPDGLTIQNAQNPNDWNYRMIGPGGKNIHAVHGAGYGLHINTVDQHPEKYGLEVHNGKFAPLHVKNDGRSFLHHSNPNDWGFRMHGPNNANVHAVHGAGYGLHVNTMNQEPGKWALDVSNGKANLMHVKNDGLTFQNHSNPNDWGYRMYGPGGKNMHAVHGAGYGLHVNTVDQHPEKYGLEIHNGAHHTLHVKNDGRHFLHHSNKGDWGFRMIGPDGRNIHAVHGAGYGLHVNTVDQDPNKYGFEVHNGKIPTVHVKNDGRQFLNHVNPNDWGFRMYGPGGKNIHAVHGAGYGLHVNTVDQNPDKYGLEVHNGKFAPLHIKNDGRAFLFNGSPGDWGFRVNTPKGTNMHAVHGGGYGMHLNTVDQDPNKYAMDVVNGKHHLLHIRNDGRHFLHHSHPGDWGFRMGGPHGGNIHAVHSHGYGFHVNTNNQENAKYGLEVFNGKKPVLQVRNDGEMIQFRKDGRATHFDHVDGQNYIRGNTIIDGDITVNGKIHLGNGAYLEKNGDGFWFVRQDGRQFLGANTHDRLWVRKNEGANQYWYWNKDGGQGKINF